MRPWSGTGIRHIPANSPFDVLDTRFAGRVGDNRWNQAGDPTLYLASDKGVALAAFARHFRERHDPALGPLATERAVFALDVTVERLLDLRRPEARAALSLHGGARRFVDASVARATATFVRRTTEAEALLVPPVTFLDDSARWNLVLFLAKLPRDLRQFVTVRPAGTFVVSPYQATSARAARC